MMTYFPDVREQFEYAPYRKTDEPQENPYYEENLYESGKNALQGFDYAVVCAKSFFYNLDVYEAELRDAGIDVSSLKNNAELLDNIMEHWMEMDRNDFVVSMLDEQFAEDEAQE